MTAGRSPDRTGAFTIAAASIYIGSVVAANVLSSRYGMVWVFPGLVASAGTYAAGFALGARDVVQDSAGRLGVLGVIAVASILSFLLADPSIALASLAAFLTSEVADFAVYTPLRSKGWARAVIASNTVGAIVDTIVFLWIAPFPLTGQGVAGQLVGKVLWATLLPVAVVSAVCMSTRQLAYRRAAGGL